MRRITWLIMLSLAVLLLSSGAAVAKEEGDCHTTVAEGESIRDATDDATDGEVVCVAEGDYEFSDPWDINTSITLLGLGDVPSDVTIDRSGHTGYSLSTSADGLTLENFELVGNPSADNAGYGIKAEASADLTISQIAVEDTGKSAIDLNGIDGADISDVRTEGAGGNGLAVTDSVDIDVEGLTATDNSWSGVALYGGQQNYFDRDMQGVDVFSITDSTLEGADLGLQIEDSSPDSEAEFGEITIEGVEFADNPLGQVLDKTNTTFEDGDLQQILENNTFDRAALARENPIVGGAIFSSIQDAVDLAESNSDADTVEVEPGDYSENVLIEKTLSLEGESSNPPTVTGSLDLAGHTSGPVTDVSISDIDIDAASDKIGLHTLSNTEGPYETHNLQVSNVDITTNGSHGIGLFDVDGADFQNVVVNANGEDTAMELIGVTGLELTDSQIEVDQGKGLNLFHADGYQPSEDITVSDVAFTSSAAKAAVVDADLSDSPTSGVNLLLDDVTINRPQAATVPSVQVAGRENVGESPVPQVTVRQSSVSHSESPPDPEEATSTIRVAGHANLLVEDSELIGGPIGGYAEAELFAFDNDISFTGDEGIWNGPGDAAEVRLVGNQVTAADQTNSGSPDVMLLDLPAQLNQESDWDEETAALEICDTNDVDSVLIGSDYADAVDCPEPPDPAPEPDEPEPDDPEAADIDLQLDLRPAPGESGELFPGESRLFEAVVEDEGNAAVGDVTVELQIDSAGSAQAAQRIDGEPVDGDGPVEVAEVDLGADDQEIVGFEVSFPEAGDYTLTGTAATAGGDAQASDELDVTVAQDPVEPAAITDELDGPTERVAGETRIETAVQTSQAQFPEDDSAQTVVIARHDEYADALAGGPLAFAADAPILLTPTGELHQATAGEVDRLGAQQAYILGGDEAVSPAVEEALIDGTAVETVTRLAGAERFATAAAVADELADVRGVESFDSAYVTRGVHPEPDRGWADAVSVSGLAAAQGRPILLSTLDELPAPTETALGELGVGEATIVGGPAAVDEGVADAIGAQVASVDRRAGDTRYHTSVAVAEESVAAGFGPERTWLATGRDYPDAITGGPAVARDGAALVLIDGDTPSASQVSLDWLADTADQREQLRLLGGTNAITDAVLDAVE